MTDKKEKLAWMQRRRRIMTDNDTRILLAANRAIRNERVTVSFAADRLRDILRNDNFEPDALDGMEDYLIRSVVEALFGGIEP